MRVLVAHEAEDVRARVRGVLEPLGHEVRDCGDAADALAACTAWDADVALLDGGLTRKDGVSLLSALKGDTDAYRAAVILIVDGEPELEEALTQLRRGAHDFLVGREMAPAATRAS